MLNHSDNEDVSPEEAIQSGESHKSVSPDTVRWFRPGAWTLDLIICTIAVASVLSFKITDALLLRTGLPYTGIAHVLLYWITVTALVYRQIFVFRFAVKEMLVTRILNRDFWFTHWLMKQNIILNFFAFFASVLIAASLLVYVYISGPWMQGLMLFDAILFVILFRRVHLTFMRRVFQPDIARIVSEFAPVMANVLLLFVAFLGVSFLDHTEVFALGDVSLPEHVTQHIYHSWRPFRMIVRTAYFLELNIRSLRSLPEAGWYLYVAMYMTTVSLVPYSALSMLQKSALNLCGRNFAYPGAMTKEDSRQ